VIRRWIHGKWIQRLSALMNIAATEVAASDWQIAKILCW